ncbi:E3 SUMO-protein ligase SIZ2 (E3 SUMO-protein transferase SIZ2) (SAP and Miz-finger domain-containing protein 2), partial [Durusdinium trenchii]
SLLRIEQAARGSACEHLQCFDLNSYIHTMRNIPPKHAWCCPICDKPAPIHQLRLDAFAQSVIDSTASNVTEVLVADNGKFEAVLFVLFTALRRRSKMPCIQQVSATEDDLQDSSDEEALKAEQAAQAAATTTPAAPRVAAPQLSQAELQQAALNLGRAFSVRAPRAAPKGTLTASPASPPEQPPTAKENHKPKERKRSVVEKGGVYCGTFEPFQTCTKLLTAADSLDAAFFVASFEEEGYYTVGDLREDGQEVVSEFVTALSMPRGTDERFLRLSFEDGENEQEPPEDPASPVARLGTMDPSWLEIIAPLYSMHMGCENMGPLLYSLVRFVKPSHCLEIGAGYTSAFLLQALEDNQRELQFWEDWRGREAGPQSWLVSELAEKTGEEGSLHCVDNFAHEHSTAPLLSQIAKRLRLQHRLRLHLDDARAFVEEADMAQSFDFVWLDGLLDFAPPKKGDVRASIDSFLSLLWPHLAPGALILLHSTLTNSSVRGWLENISASPWGPPNNVLSLLEPHKKFQNSVTILQHRPDGYAEPIYSKLP